MTRGHLLSEIRDIVGAIKVLKSYKPLTWKTLMNINDLEEKKSKLWERVKKLKETDNPIASQ